LLAQKKGAKKKAADFDADLFLTQPSRDQNRHLEHYFVQHFAPNNKQDGINRLCWVPHAVRVFKVHYESVLFGEFECIHILLYRSRMNMSG